MFPIKKSLFELRPWQLEDAASLAENANNINIWNNVRDGFPHPYTIEDGKAYIAMDAQRPYIQNLAIIIDNKAVGGVGIVPKTDVERFSAEMGYWIGEDYWGKGIITEVVKTALDYFFSHTEIVHIYAFVYEHNIASMRVLEKAGFRKVGIMEKAVYKNNEFLDITYYEILSS